MGRLMAFLPVLLVLQLLTTGVRAQSPRRVVPVVNTMATSKAGFTTYQVVADFSVREAADVYAVFGEPSRGCSRASGPNCRNLRLPPAFQVATPFGTNTGPTNPAFWESPHRVLCVCLMHDA